MKKKYVFFGSALITISSIGCHFYKQEFFILEKINLYNDSSKNEQIGKDLMYYDYTALIKDSLKITDPAYLQNIGWQEFLTSDTKEITFRLRLQNEALENKKELIALFDHFVINKLDEYKKKEKEIDTAIRMGYYYIDLINQSYYDSTWNQSSPLLEKYASEQQFINVLRERNAHYKSPPDLKVEARIMANEIDNIAGDFYTIYYFGGNNAKEKITMEKIDQTYKLLGYQYDSPKQK